MHALPVGSARLRAGRRRRAVAFARALRLKAAKGGAAVVKPSTRGALRACDGCLTHVIYMAAAVAPEALASGLAGEHARTRTRPRRAAAADLWRRVATPCEGAAPGCEPGRVARARARTTFRPPVRWRHRRDPEAHAGRAREPRRRPSTRPSASRDGERDGPTRGAREGARDHRSHVACDKRGRAHGAADRRGSGWLGGVAARERRAQAFGNAESTARTSFARASWPRASPDGRAGVCDAKAVLEARRERSAAVRRCRLGGCRTCAVLGSKLAGGRVGAGRRGRPRRRGSSRGSPREKKGKEAGASLIARGGRRLLARAGAASARRHL